MKIEVSTGEVVDKATILAIKLEKFRSNEKKRNVRKEYDILQKYLKEINITPETGKFRELKEINLKLWDIEDEIRVKEAQKKFDDRFIQLARSVYFTNDKRASIKKEINRKFGSELTEEKEYVEYGEK